MLKLIPSINRRIIVCYSVSMLLITAIALYGLYASLRHYTEHMVFQQMHQQFNHVFVALRVNAHKPDMQHALTKLTHQRPGTKAFYNHYIRIIDQQGRSVWQTPGMSKVLPENLFPVPGREDVFSNLNSYQFKQNLNYVLQTAHYQLGAKQWIIQLAINRDAELMCVGSYVESSGMIMLVVFLIIFLIGYLVASSSLNPLHQLNHALTKLSFSDPKARLCIDDWPVELRTTAASLNQTLDTINERYTRLKHFSTDLAHELRTPLNRIINQLEVGLQNPRSAAEYQKILDEILESCQATSALIDDMLFIAKAKQQQIELAPVAIHQLWQQLQAYYQILADEAGITLQITGAATIEANAPLLQRAFSNLLSNSIKYSANGATIDVTIHDHEAHTRISIQDQGIGIPEQDLPHILDRFYRVDDSRTAATGGSGIGLAIVRAIIDSHHGTIEIDSQVNVGTSVIITLPKHGVN